MNRDDIYIARLDPVEGSEMAKSRPVVIVSNDLRNQLLQTVVVCPLTRQLHPGWRSRLQVRWRRQTGGNRGGPDSRAEQVPPDAQD